MSMSTVAFEAVIQLLLETRLRYKEIADPIFDRILDDAYRLSLGCIHYNEKKNWHEHALSEAQQEENRLMWELTSMLDVIQKQNDELDQAPSNDVSNETLRAKMAEQRLLLQRIRKLIASTGNDSHNIDFSPPLARDLSESNGEQSDPDALSLSLNHQTANHSSKPANEGIDINADNNMSTPSLVIYFLGIFRVFGNDQLIKGWPNCKGKSIFKYLATHRGHPVAKELLMETFWPDSSPEAARNNLNVSIFGLRKALSKSDPSFSHVLFQDGCYFLNPELNVRIDSELFKKHLNHAQLANQSDNPDQAIKEYRSAKALYQTGFLVEDRYEDWLFPLQQHYQDCYIKLLEQLGNYYFDKKNYNDCACIYTDQLNVDSCDENVHRKLMVCYSRSGQPHLALRQYHICVETLARELDMSPALKTVELFKKIKRREGV